MWSPVSYRAEFRNVDITCKSSGKQSELTPNSRISQPLAFVDMMRKVWKTCRNLVLQRGHHMSHVVPSLLLGWISTCGYLLPIEWQIIGINGKQRDFVTFGLFWQEGSFEELETSRFAKRGFCRSTKRPRSRHQRPEANKSCCLAWISVVHHLIGKRYPHDETRRDRKRRAHGLCGPPFSKVGFCNSPKLPSLCQQRPEAG